MKMHIIKDLHCMQILIFLHTTADLQCQMDGVAMGIQVIPMGTHIHHSHIQLMVVTHKTIIGKI